MEARSEEMQFLSDLHAKFALQAQRLGMLEADMGVPLREMPASARSLAATTFYTPISDDEYDWWHRHLPHCVNANEDTPLADVIKSVADVRMFDAVTVLQNPVTGESLMLGRILRDDDHDHDHRVAQYYHPHFKIFQWGSPEVPLSVPPGVRDFGNERSFQALDAKLVKGRQKLSLRKLQLPDDLMIGVMAVCTAGLAITAPFAFGWGESIAFFVLLAFIAAITTKAARKRHGNDRRQVIANGLTASTAAMVVPPAISGLVWLLGFIF